MGFLDKAKAKKAAKWAARKDYGGVKAVGGGVKTLATKDLRGTGTSASERIQVYSGWRFFTQFIFGILKWVGIIGGSILLFTGLVLGGIYLFGLNSTGAGQAALGHAKVALEDSGVPILAKLGALSIFDIVKNPEKPFLDSSFDVKSANSDKYIEIDKPQARKPAYLPGEAITVNAQGTAYKLAQKTKAKVRCSLKNYDKEIVTSISPQSENGQLVIDKDIEQPFAITCVFDEGVTPSGDKPLDAPTGTIGVDYTATAQSIWEAYYIYERNKDNEKIVDPNVNAGVGLSRPFYNSPMSIVFDSLGFKMPFYQNEDYTFDIKLVKGQFLSGNLKSINRLCLFVPDNVQLDTSDRRFCDFVETSNCAVETVGEYDYSGYRTYELRQDILDEKNVDCGDAVWRKLNGLTEQNCIDFYKGDIAAQCKFRFTGLQKGDRSVTTLDLHAVASYEFSVERSFAVDVYNKGSQIDPCIAINSDTVCNQEGGCWWKTDKCESCPLSITQCGGYDKESDCVNNYCLAGKTCSWSDGKCI